MQDDLVLRRDAEQRADQFAFELSELGRKYGIGVGGSPVLYLLERDDYFFDYSVDDNSGLRFGDAQRDPASRARRNA